MVIDSKTKKYIIVITFIFFSFYFGTKFYVEKKRRVMFVGEWITKETKGVDYSLFFVNDSLLRVYHSTEKEYIEYKYKINDNHLLLSDEFDSELDWKYEIDNSKLKIIDNNSTLLFYKK
jgi:hypothetical protein